MHVGMIGLGKMGGNMATRLVRGGHRVVGTAREAGAREQSRATAASPRPTSLRSSRP
jgi:6-phosphogluconate dehydrogenase